MEVVQWAGIQNIHVLCSVFIILCVMSCISTCSIFAAPRPQFEQTMYTVPENDRTVPLCIDIGVDVPEPMNFTITAIQKAPPEADGLL